MSTETKTLRFDVKALGITKDADGQEFGQIEALGAVFNNVDEGRDRILPGAFTRTIKNSKERAAARQKKYILKMLWNHSPDDIIGGWYDLTETPDGLLAKGDIALATQRGREYYALAKAGMSDDLSIIYDIPSGGAKFTKEGVRDLSEMRLYSVDPVTFPMNDETAVVAVKAAAKARGRTMQKKTFQEHYTEQQCCDLLRDWQDVVLSAFTSAVYDAFQIGDTPETDINDALDALKGAVSEWVAEGMQYGLSDYLDAQGYDGGSESRMQNGTSYGYGYYGMSRSTPMHRKAMTASDATTGGFTSGQVDKLKGAADKASKAVDKHVAALSDAAEGVKTLIGQAAKAAKAGRAFSAANEQALSDHADALDSAASTLQKSMTRHLSTVNTVADDLATVLQGAEEAYGTDAGTPANGEQEGKNHRAPSRQMPGTRAAHTPPSQRSDTASDEDVAHALASLKKLRIPA